MIHPKDIMLVENYYNALIAGRSIIYIGEHYKYFHKQTLAELLSEAYCFQTPDASVNYRKEVARKIEAAKEMVGKSRL